MSRSMQLKDLALVLALALVPTLASAAEPAVPADIQEHPACIHCGMNRQRWSHTRHLVEYQDGHVEPTCSLRCVALSLDMNWGRTPTRISGAAQDTGAEIEPLLPVEKLTYVLQKDQRGTMTPRSKYAYASEAKARAAAGKTGKLMAFPEALKEAYSDVADAAVSKLGQSQERSRRTKR